MKRVAILLSLLLLVALAVPAQQRRSQQRKQTTTKTTARKRTATKQSAGRETVKSLQNRRQQLQRQMKEQQRRYAQNERVVKERLQNLMMLNSEIDHKRKTIDTIRRDLSVLDTTIVSYDKQLTVLRQELEDRKQRYMKSMRYMRRNRTIQSRMMFIFSADNLNQMYRRMRFMREYATFQKAQGEAVKSKQEQVEQKLADLNNAKTQKRNLLWKDEQERKQLEGKQVEHQQVVKSLQRQQKTIQALMEKQRQEDAALNVRIDQLIAQEVARAKARAEAEARRKAEEAARRQREAELAAKRKAEREAAADKQQGSKTKSKRSRKSRRTEVAEADVEKRETKPVETFVTSEDQRISGSFESNRGRLPMPITGAYRIVNGYGQYDVEGLKGVRLNSKGVHIKGQPGAQARSVFDGEVSGVYQFGGTKVVMVRHGSYISVYCNLSTVNVSRGQKVSARQVLGTIGGENILQFQLRKWTETLNPLRWLGR